MRGSVIAAAAVPTATGDSPAAELAQKPNVVVAILGLDHEKMTYRSASRDFQLTDVNGKVAKEILW